jgi:hypothetical protein
LEEASDWDEAWEATEALSRPSASRAAARAALSGFVGERATLDAPDATVPPPALYCLDEPLDPTEALDLASVWAAVKKADPFVDPCVRALMFVAAVRVEALEATLPPPP